MEQADLRRLERQCVQEETPRCTAACPLHVDVKTFCKLMGQRRVDKAWQVLAKTLPLPGILARLCDGPCRSACVREEAGGAIEVDALEQFCADNAKPVAPPRPLPSRHKFVAVLGGSLTGLCAAWEMARRGFDVTLYCSGEDGSLLNFPAEVLPEGVAARELENLEKLGVVIRKVAEWPQSLLDSLLEDTDAVFVDSDGVPAELMDFGLPDALTLGTTRPGLFACRAGEVSAIMQAAAGRRAANSIERFTQGVSLVANRDLEGPYATRLYTSLDKVESVPPVPSDGGHTELTARDEARRCLQCECMECVKGCEYLHHFKQYPKVYARQIYNNESIVMGTRQANTLINSCMLCGLCETLCPEDFSMADVCLTARQTLVERGHMPPSAHEFALRDMAFADGDSCALGHHAPGTDASDYVFFPGCQLTASAPGSVEAAYADLRGKLGAVGLMLRCCSAPAKWSGRQGMFEEAMDAVRAEWERLGSPRIIAACPTCLTTLREGLPDAEIVSHWSILRAVGLPDSAHGLADTLALNDPCAVRHENGVREDVRSILADLSVQTVEPEYTGETTQCCGYGGLLSEANPDLGRAVADKRAASMDEDWITYCVMCRDMFARSGKRAMHLYDVLYPDRDDPGARPAPGYSERRENRVRLREQLLRDVWGEEDGAVPEPFESVVVEFTDEGARVMEDRRILKSDVQKVLFQAGESGVHLVNVDSGRLLTSFRPAVVTYWVEYELNGDGYRVHNAWSHRMKILGGQP